MLEHMAMFHMLRYEEEVASWLLWERKSMMTYAIDNPDIVDVMKDNIILQLMVNKFFDGKAGEMLLPKFPNLLEYGEGLSQTTSSIANTCQ